MEFSSKKVVDTLSKNKGPDTSFLQCMKNALDICQSKALCSKTYSLPFSLCVAIWTVFTKSQYVYSHAFVLQHCLWQGLNSLLDIEHPSNISLLSKYFVFH